MLCSSYNNKNNSNILCSISVIRVKVAPVFPASKCVSVCYKERFANCIPQVMFGLVRFNVRAYKAIFWIAFPVHFIWASIYSHACSVARLMSGSRPFFFLTLPRCACSMQPLSNCISTTWNVRAHCRIRGMWVGSQESSCRATEYLH